MKLGEFLSSKRKEKGMTVREFAKKIEISPSFLCDLESGYRSFPSENKIEGLFQRIVCALEMSDEDSSLFEKMIDESMFENGKMPHEIAVYLQAVPEAQVALRKAKNNEVGNDVWEAFSKALEKKKGK